MFAGVLVVVRSTANDAGTAAIIVDEPIRVCANEKRLDKMAAHTWDLFRGSAWLTVIGGKLDVSHLRLILYLSQRW